MKIIVLSLVMLVPTLVYSADQQKRPATPKPAKKIYNKHLANAKNAHESVEKDTHREAGRFYTPKKSSSKGASLPKTQPAKGNADNQ
jgi:hypothetical protein